MAKYISIGLCIVLALAVSVSGVALPTPDLLYTQDSINAVTNTWDNMGSSTAPNISPNIAGLIQSNMGDRSGDVVCFASNNGCVQIDFDISPATLPELTMEIYAYQISKANIYGWAMSQDTGSYGRSIVMHDWRFGNGIAATRWSGKGSYTGHPPLNDAEWGHIVAVWNQNTQTISTYKNGVPITVSGFSPGGSTSFCLNTNIGHSGHQWNGCFAKAAVYSNALDNEQVTQLYNEYINPSTTPEPCDPECNIQYCPDKSSGDRRRRRLADSNSPLSGNGAKGAHKWCSADTSNNVLVDPFSCADSCGQVTCHDCGNHGLCVSQCHRYLRQSGLKSCPTYRGNWCEQQCSAVESDDFKCFKFCPLDQVPECPDSN